MDAQATFSCSFRQCDLHSLRELSNVPRWPAQGLLPEARRDLAVQILAGAEPVAGLAEQHEVSRKFLYQQAHTAQNALTRAFDPEPKTKDVLFYLPVTKAWLRQLVLALVLIGHTPYRAVVELLRDLFDWNISLGSVHNIVHSAVELARAISRRCDLAGVRIGAHDEIFQASHPVLVGVDTASTYCYLLSLEDHRDADTWACACWSWSIRASTPMPLSPTQARVCVLAKPWPCPRFPAGATSSMSSVSSSNSLASWRTVPMTPCSVPNDVGGNARLPADTTGGGMLSQ
jgi:hypothetical protein